MIFFRTSPAIYAQLQPAIDVADQCQPAGIKSYINDGNCEHIFPPIEQVAPANDGMVYMAVSEWMLQINGAPDFAEHVEQITEEQYQAATQGDENQTI